MIKQLNALASEMVGDGKSPNLFFVTVKGNVVLTATDFAQAYGYWKSLARGYPKRIETMLEDRKVGIIASAGMERGYGTQLRSEDRRLHWARAMGSTRRFLYIRTQRKE